MRREILIATHNLHKKEEIQQILGEDFIVKSLTDYGIHDEIVEDGKSFHENAEIKAKESRETLGTRIVQMALDFAIRHDLLDTHRGWE